MSDDSPIAQQLASLPIGSPARIYPGRGYENGVSGGNRALIVAPMDPGEVLVGNVVLQKKALREMIEWLDSPECR